MKLKSYIGLTLAAGLLGAALVACSPDVSTADFLLGGSQTAETTALSGITTANSAVQGELTITGSSGTLYNAAGQRYVLSFNRVIDNTSAVLAAFSFFNISNPTAAGTTNVIGSTVSFTASVVPSTSGGSDVIFTIDGSTITADYLGCKIDATVLTAKNGTYKLDTNGNGIYGEAGDIIYSAIPVNATNGITLTAITSSSNMPDPSSTLSPSFLTSWLNSGVYDVDNYGTGTNALFFTVTDSGSATGNLVTVATDAATVYKNVAGVWTLVGATSSYDPTTFRGIITLTAAPVAGEAYKIVLDYYKIYESQDVLGSTHRASYDQYAVNESGYAHVFYVTFDKGSGSNETLSAAGPSGPSKGYYVDLTINSANTPIDMATVSSASLKVYVDHAILADGSSYTGFVSYTQTLLGTSEYTDGTTYTYNAVRSLRLYLPNNINSITGTYWDSVSSSWKAREVKIYIAPSVLSTSSAIEADSLRSFGDVNGTDGWKIYTAS